MVCKVVRKVNEIRKMKIRQVRAWVLPRCSDCRYWGFLWSDNRERCFDCARIAEERGEVYDDFLDSDSGSEDYGVSRAC